MGFLVFIGFLLFRQVAPWTPQITVYSPRTHIYILYLYNNYMEYNVWKKYYSSRDYITEYISYLYHSIYTML